MRINHTIDIFIENKKWLNKKVFTTRKGINKAIYNFSYCALKNGILLSKFNQDKKIKKFESKINFILADDQLLQKLNTKFLKKKKPTNVLSFPNDNLRKDRVKFLGEVFLAYETCIKEAKKLNVKNIDRVAHLIVHGTLHLLGFTHHKREEEKKMNNLETQTLNSLGIYYYN